MGPKLSAVPITLGLAYVGMAYLSWTLAGIICGENSESFALVASRRCARACVLHHGFVGLVARPRLVNYFACMGLAARGCLLRCAVHQLLRLVPNRICHLPIVRGFLAATLFDASPVRPPLASGGYFLRSVGGWEFAAGSATAPI